MKSGRRSKGGRLWLRFNFDCDYFFHCCRTVTDSASGTILECLQRHSISWVLWGAGAPSQKRLPVAAEPTDPAAVRYLGKSNDRSCAMKTFYNCNQSIFLELAEAQRRVPEINALIEDQRELIEELQRDGSDLTSAKIVFDSLLVSLSLCVQDRHRLYKMSNIESGQASAA